MGYKAELLDSASIAVGAERMPDEVFDNIFLVGTVGPSTASPLCPLFDFVEEFAFSPELDDGAPGFHFEDGIVLRRQRMQSEDQKRASLSEPSAQNYYGAISAELLDTWTHCFTHECLHARSGSSTTRYPFVYGLWMEHVESDILRLCTSPQTLPTVETGTIRRTSRTLSHGDTPEQTTSSSGSSWALISANSSLHTPSIQSSIPSFDVTCSSIGGRSSRPAA